MASGLLDKANIILTPTGYKAGTMYNVAPIEQPYEDFVFSRASVASRVNSSGLVEMVGRTLGSNLVQNGDFSEIGPDLVQNGTFDLGSELVTNGDFATDSDWSTIGTWDIVNNQAEAIGNGISQYIQQDFTISNGNIYKFTYEIIENTLNGNGASLSSSGGFGSVSISNVVGTHTEYITASNDTATYALKIGVSGTATSGTIKLDNVSVKEVPDWTLTQATVSNNTLQLSTTDGSYTAATQSLGSIGESYKIQLDVSNIVGTISVAIGGGTDVDITTNGTHTIYIKSASTTFELKRKFGITNVSASINNVVVQELDPNDYWNLGTGWSIGDGKLEGTNVNGVSSEQSGYTFVGKTFQVSYTISDYTQGSVQIYLGGVQATSLKDVNGVHTETITITSGNSTLYVYGVSNFTGSIDNVSAQEVIDTNNIPRINYDSNGENGHWLLEPTSTNLF